ncbi:MAG: DUF721 domain-containing protein [Acidobacteria bacterium]|nr:DUF721 domain-containing protein [Acidobacteriota bacterium]
MERASRLIGKIGFPGDTTIAETLARAAWPVAVGRKIAAHAHATRMVRSSLIVEVEDAVWQKQLFTLRSQILPKLRSNLGEGIVEEIEFRVMPRRREPQLARRMEPARSPGDDAEQIPDPVLRRIYRDSRKKALA